jgi:WD40 repeat protein
LWPAAPGQRAAAGDPSGKVHVWDWQARRRVASLEAPFEWFGSLRFSRRGTFLFAKLVLNDDTAKVKVWRTGDWEPVPLAAAQETGIASVDLSPDERRLAAGYLDGRVKLWSFPAGQHEATWHHHREGVYGVLFSENGRVLASTSTDGTVRLWDLVAYRELVLPLRGHTGWAWGPAFSPDGRRLASGGDSANDAVKLWDLATHRELLTLPGDGQIFMDVSFSPDGNTLVATSLNGIAHFWRAPSWVEIEAAEKRQVAP